MRHISPAKAAIAVGTVTALWHLVWIMLVGVGWAKAVLDFVLELHFLKISYVLAPFSPVTAGSLVVLTFAIGALFGLIFALVWNWLTLESGPEWTRDTHKYPSNQAG